MKVLKTKSGSVKVDTEILYEAKKICKEKGVKILFYVTEALKEKNQKEKTNVV